MSFPFLSLYLSLVLALQTKTPTINVPAVTVASDGWLTVEQKRRAEQMTNMFENGVIENDYASIANIDDGRGYTAGRIGFTTATGDAEALLKRYAVLHPNNVLNKYLPTLVELREDKSGDVSDLSGYVDAWKKSASDPLFRRAQDDVVDDLYYRPVMKMGDDLGLKLPLSRAALYDAMIQHGDGDEPDSLPALIERTNEQLGGSPNTGKDEKQWLKRFVEVRKADLLHAYNEESREAWKESASRLDIYSDLITAGNWQLNGPIHLKGDYEATIQ